MTLGTRLGIQKDNKTHPQCQRLIWPSLQLNNGICQALAPRPPDRLTFQGPFVELVQEIIWQLVLFVAHQLDTADG